MRAAVLALVDPRSRASLRHEVVEPGVHAHLPQGGVNDRRMCGIPCEVHGARRLVHVKHLLPMLAPIVGQKDAALRIGAEHVPKRGDQYPIGIGRID